MSRDCIECGNGIVPGNPSEHCTYCVEDLRKATATPESLLADIHQLLAEVEEHNVQSKVDRAAGRTFWANWHATMARVKLDRADVFDKERVEKMTAPALQTLAAE